MLKDVVAVEALEPYRLRLVFEDGVAGEVVGLVDRLQLDGADANTKCDLFEHVLKQIKQAGELSQFRTPRHIIRAMVG